MARRTAEHRHEQQEQARRAAEQKAHLIENEMSNGKRAVWECVVDPPRGSPSSSTVWKPYDDDVRQALELGSQANETAIYFDRAGVAYEARQGPSSKWTQMRIDNGKTRDMRRREESLATRGGMVLYHQTDEPTAEIILRTQEMKPGTGGLAGPGIYFATSKELTGHKAHKRGVILEASVRIGKIHTLEGRGDMQMTGSKLRGMGCESVCIAREVSSGQEYVVYNSEQVLSIKRAP